MRQYYRQKGYSWRRSSDQREVSLVTALKRRRIEGKTHDTSSFKFGLVKLTVRVSCFISAVPEVNNAISKRNKKVG